jgi:anti-anti-sigma factor
MRPASSGGIILRLQVERYGEANLCVLRCLGSIVFGPEVEHLRTRITELLDQCCCLILNLVHVERLDASGLGLLAWLCGEMMVRRRSAKLVCSSERIQDLLELSALVRRLEIYSTETAAWQSCRQIA